MLPRLRVWQLAPRSTISTTTKTTATTSAVRCLSVIPPATFDRTNGKKYSWRSSNLVYQTQQSFSTRTNDNNKNAVVSRQDVLDEAAALTKSLYRLCMRCTKVIREGNLFDEKEFQKREEEFANPSTFGGGLISMAPPPDREDELRSRAEYYEAYTREYFTQESDCLDNDPLREKDIRRYLFYLRKGEKDRKWLMADMMFKDPYKNTFDHKRVEQFEIMAQKHLGIYEEKLIAQDQIPDDDGDDGFFDDEESDPEWFQKKYPNLK